jgi:hypothetical protein
MRKSSVASIAAVALASLLVLMGGYLGSYYALLVGSELTLDTDNEFVRVPVYRSENRILYGVLWPANQIDRVIRPDHWRLRPFSPY